MEALIAMLQFHTTSPASAALVAADFAALSDGGGEDEEEEGDASAGDSDDRLDALVRRRLSRSRAW